MDIPELCSPAPRSDSIDNASVIEYYLSEGRGVLCECRKGLKMGRCKRVVVGLAVVALLSLVFAGVGCQQGRQSGGAGHFDYERIELANGLEVITLEDFSCPIAAVQVWYHVGSKDEQPDRQGFAHMFEHMMFRGTDKLGPTDHFGFIRRVGGTTNGYTSFDRTVYLETLPADQLDLALWLEAERMAFLKIDQEAFDTERRVVEEERRMGLSEPYGTVFERLLEQIYQVHPYRWPPIGKISHLRAASVQELRDFWTKNYVPSNATLIIVGAVEHEDAQDMARKYFGWIPRYAKPPQVDIAEPEPAGPRSLILDRENAPAPSVSVIFRTVPVSHGDTEPLDLLTQILGSGHSSRLYRELVAEKQLAVQIDGWHYSLEQDGILQAEAILSPNASDANEVLRIIKEHIARLRTEPVRDRELLKARNQMLRDIITQNLTINNKARMLGNSAVVYGDVGRVNRQLDAIRAVTCEDILRVAKVYLSDERALEVEIKRNSPESADPSIVAEQNAPITAEPEQVAPKPGRAGVARPVGYSDEPPFAKLAASNVTPKYGSKALGNGLKVLVVANNEVPFVTVRLGLLSGGWTEDKPGTAAMAMKMLVKGTAGYSEGELADELETYAIGLSGSGDMDTSSVNMSCLKEHLGRAMNLLGEVVQRPTFPVEEFEKLRKQVLTSLAVSSAEPDYIADREFRRRLYGEHPYSRTATGEVEDVNSLLIGDLRNWWSEFARPDTAVLIVAGDIGKAEAFELAEKTFGSWQALGLKPKVELPALAVPAETRIYLVDRPGSIQSQIRVGQLGITRHNEAYFVSRIVNSYFGWGFDSRLNKSIRVDKGLTYGVWGGYFAQRFAGDFKVQTFSKTESTAEAVQAVLDEIERLRDEGPSEDELANSQTYILGSFVRGRETPQQIAADLWLIESQQLGGDYLERLLSGITEAEREDCEELVEQTVEPGQLVIVVVGEADKLKEPLERITPVTVVEAENPV